MNVEDFMRQMQGMSGMNNQSVLTRQPTTEELDKFIDRCMEEHDLNAHMLHNALVYKLQPPNGHTVMNSLEEEEIYPLVLNRIQERFSK